jgi:hypothetical protein
MMKPLLLAGIVAVIAAPAASQATTLCRRANQNNEVAGTLVGAVAGGLIGNAITHGRDRAAGTAIGAVGGAVIGNRIAASSNQPCPDGYYAYEDGVVTDGYAQTQYQYRTDGARYLGPPVYERGYNAQPFTQTPAYYYNNQAGYANNQPRYGYEGPGYSYESPVYGEQGYSYTPSYTSSYTTEQNYRERRAFAANQQGYSHSYYSDPYPSSGYAAQSATTWRDGYGRSCYWGNGSNPDGSPGWIQVCR